MTEASVEQSKAAKANTIEEIKARKKAVTKQVAIQLDGEIADRISDLRKLHTAARDADRLSNEPDEAPKIQEQINTLVEESKDTEVVFTFKSVGRFRYDELVTAHQPTKEAKKEGAEFNADTFPPALVAESCVEPKMSLEDATEIFASPDWNGAELRRIFFGALEVNTETGDIPLSRGESDGSLSSLLSLITQQNGASPTLSM